MTLRKAAGIAAFLLGCTSATSPSIRAGAPTLRSASAVLVYNNHGDPTAIDLSAHADQPVRCKYVSLLPPYTLGNPDSTLAYENMPHTMNGPDAGKFNTVAFERIPVTGSGSIAGGLVTLTRFYIRCANAQGDVTQSDEELVK